MQTTKRTKRVSITVALPGWFVAAWVLMIGMGVWHSHRHTIPTIGFWPSLMICFAASLINETLVEKKWSRTRTHKRTWS